MLEQEFRTGTESRLRFWKDCVPLEASSLARVRDTSTASDPWALLASSERQELSLIPAEGRAHEAQHVDTPLPTGQAGPLYASETRNNL